ncbi:MAG: DUF2058 domain-containing protein [Gammaproteobacteria bacterium]|nr:DUF2058 domain-containing protein [Gammaproteobacteria bacterium]
MGSIHDQLLQVGLVDEKQIKKAKIDKRKQERQRRKSKPKTGKQDKSQLRPALAEKIERDRELNRQRQRRAERKAVAAQIKQLIETNRQVTGDGDLPFNFADHKKIKRIYITEVEREQLSRGTLAIVKLNGRYELVPSTIVEKIRLRDEKYVILCNEPQEKKADHADDPYSDYRVPDDLVW